MISKCPVYFDLNQHKLVLAPEYGGDGGKTVGLCADKRAPIAAFPGHWAPNDLLLYDGRQFPAAYQGNAFIAFHGSWVAPITLVTVIPNLMMVPTFSPAKSVKDFIDYAKANRGNVSFASTGVGASPHLSGELFKRRAGIEMIHVPYRGAGPAMNDLIPGRVDVMFSNLPGVLPHVQSGTIRGLAVTSAKRSPAAPDIPTIAETLPGYEVSGWWGLFAPAKTPNDIVMKIHADAIAALSHPSVKQRYDAIGAPVTSSTPGELAALLSSETQKWAALIKEAGIKAEGD
jgi:tripartite-type tricarboxylate transporter receptor subunit TctC